MKEVFPGIFSDGRRLFTKSLVPGFHLFKEQFFREDGEELVEFPPFRSKLAAAIKNGLKVPEIRPGANVLYLGCSEGRTVQHVSNIVGEKGSVFGVDISEGAMKRFLELCEARKNVVPILSDANNPSLYSEYLKGVRIDVLFQDIAQKNQAEIFNKNAELFLQKGAIGVIAIKARSISQRKNVREIFDEEIKKLREQFDVLKVVSLSSFERDHVVVLCKKKKS